MREKGKKRQVDIDNGLLGAWCDGVGWIEWVGIIRRRRELLVMYACTYVRGKKERQKEDDGLLSLAFIHTYIYTYINKKAGEVWMDG